MAGLATLPVVGHAATAVGWQKSLTEAFSAKTSVRAASTANLTLSGTQTVDGVVLAVGDRVLVKDQAIPARNGIYIVSAGVWTRATDSDHWGKFIGANVIVTEGTANGRSQWLSTAMAGAGVLDTTSLTFAKLSGATTSSLAALASNGIVVNNGGNIVARSLAAGSSRLSVLNADGVAGNPTLDVVESNIAINNLNGTLSVSKGGTGATSLTTNGVLFGNGTGAIQVTVPGTSGQLLVANASGVPTFVSLTGDASLAASGAVTLANTGVVAGAYGAGTTVPVFSVDAKGRLTSASSVTITPAWANVTGKPTTVAGYGITNINSYAPTLTGGGASGTWGINITGNAATATMQTVTDSRSVVDTPDSYGRGVYFDLKYNTTNGLSDGGTYNGVMTLRKWGSGSDWSGGTAHQLGFTDNGDLWHRTGSGTTWNGWQEILDSTNVGSYAPSLTGAGATGTWGISVTGNAATATKLAAARTISATGDASWTATFDGSANATGTLTLANTGVTAGTYGNSTTIPVFSVDAKGRVTGVTNTAIAPAWTSITGKPTTIAGFLGTDSVDVANITSRVNSGFYQYSAATQALGWPTNSNGWYHLMSSTHSNTANYYAMQLAADFYNQKLYYRSTNGSGTTAWNEVLHSGNAPYALAMNQYLRTSDGPTFDTVYTGNWFRSNGNSGWYNQSYGGGIWMQDSSWIRTYGSKGFYVQGGSLLVDGVVYASSAIQARGGVSNDSGNLSLSAAGGTVVVNNQMQLAAVASSGAACGVAGAIARDGSNNVFICK